MCETVWVNQKSHASIEFDALRKPDIMSSINNVMHLFAQARYPRVNGVYRHVRSGRLYRVQQLAMCASTNVPVVVYGDAATTTPSPRYPFVWTRPLADWHARFVYNE